MANEPLVRLRFGIHRGVGLVSHLIQWQQRSDVSHVSIIDEDDMLIEAREWRGCVRARSLSQVQAESSSRFTVMYVEVPRSKYEAAMRFARAQLGKRYDYLSIIRFVTRHQCSRNDNGKWFCSELAFVVAKEAGVTLLQLIEPWAVSPGLFHYSPLLQLE